MKLRSALNVFATVALTLATGSFAAESKPKKEATPAPSGTARQTHAAASTPATARSLPMYARVDSIDEVNKTFTMKRKDGVEIKHVLSATAPIKNGESSAKFSEIKVGDWVAGSRIKKSETEYEVLKVTKFGVRAKKEDKKE